MLIAILSNEIPSNGVINIRTNDGYVDRRYCYLPDLKPYYWYEDGICVDPDGDHDQKVEDDAKYGIITFCDNEGYCAGYSHAIHSTIKAVKRGEPDDGYVIR